MSRVIRRAPGTLASRGMCKDIVDVPVVQLHEGFKLYHVTPRNIPENADMFQDYIERGYDIPVAGGYSLDVRHSKYFSITKYHPFYYGADKLGKRQVALMYKTIKPMILMYQRYNLDWKDDMRPRWASFDECIANNEWLTNTCLDGWIASDDPLDDWFEIYLFRPYTIVDPYPKQYLLSDRAYAQVAKGKYVWGDLESNIIDDAIDYTGVLRFTDTECYITEE